MMQKYLILRLNILIQAKYFNISDGIKFTNEILNAKIKEKDLFDKSDIIFGIIFGADMSLSVHIDNKKNDILILGEDPTDGVHDTTVNAEKECSLNFTEKQKFVQVCIIMK